MPRSGIALGNLRAIVILIVLAFHSVLPYLASLPDTPYRFDRAPYRWQAFPVIDSERWFGFDLFCAWQDLSLMALMFFLSGLFVAPSLARKGGAAFLGDRSLRIGLPLVLVVLFLIPLAYYPAYRVSAIDPGVEAYARHWFALPFWPNGPQWFLVQLLVLNALVAALHRFAPVTLSGLVRWTAPICESPARFFAALVAVSAAAYLPLALAYSPFSWTSVGPTSFQHSRPLLYLVYFLAGFAVGARGLDRGLLVCDGALARRWPVWLAAALAGFVLWALPTSAVLADWQNAPIVLKLAHGLGFAAACAGGCVVLVALCLRFARERSRVLDSLSANAYGLYLVHYVFAVWLQYALLGVSLPAVAKAAIVFAGTLLLSWSAVSALSGLSLGALPSGRMRAKTSQYSDRRAA
jgi:glucans biosynthesis protein C